MAQTDCRFFNGYKPCGKHNICDELCPSRQIPNIRILIIHLEALGAVLRSTSLLASIKRKYPSSHITWMTSKAAAPLLQHNFRIDRVLTSEPQDIWALSALNFDIAFCIDKSLMASGILAQTAFEVLYGFCVDPHSGAILPASAAAEELWQLGLSNKRKFFENQKPETQLVHEALELGPFFRDEYSLHFSELELSQVHQRRRSWALEKEIVIGINTGCSGVIPYKKLSVDYHRKLIRALHAAGYRCIVLLGGPEDDERNQQIGYGLNVFQSPTHLGIRDGLISVGACDVVVTGDSLGMHMGIALKKWVVAWFGPTCAQEIDLFERGVKVKTQASCSPCWKRSCQKTPMCYDLVSLDELVQAVDQGKRWLQSTSLSKPPSSEISSSPSL